MLNVPAAPRTLITKQLECISCHKIFAISEDFTIREKERGAHWRILPDHYPDTRLRYQSDRYRQPITPETRAIPIENNSYPDGKDRRHINCPRCGTDNRNWLHILETEPAWMQNFFPMVPIGVALTVIMFAVASWRQFNLDELSRSIFLLIAVFFAAFVPIRVMTRNWIEVREYNYAQRVASPRSFWQRMPLQLRIWLPSTGFFLFLLPFILYIVIPWAFDIGFKIISPPTPPAAEATVEQQVKNVQDDLVDLYNKVPEENTKLVSKALSSLDELAGTELVTAVQLETSEKEEGQDNVNTNQSGWFTVGREFLSDWFRLVLTSSIIGIVFGWLAVNGYVNQIDLHLPRPIFHSVAGMTRVVVWEAGASLEIGDEVDYMQWTNVRRNDTGGIVLEGLYRDATPSAETDNSLNARVRAQRYEISTDKWGHIESAQITAVRVPVRPRLPNQHEETSITSAFFRSAVHVPDAEEAPPNQQAVGEAN